MFPGFAVGAAEELVYFCVGGLPLFLIPGDGFAGLHGDIRQNAAGAGDVSLFNVRDGFGAIVDGVQEIEHVVTQCRGYVPFQILSFSSSGYCAHSFLYCTS